MKLVLALLGGAALGVVGTRLRSRAAAASPPPVGSAPAAVGPGRVAVDVSAFAD